MRKNALVKEFFMEIRKTRNRFLSIFLIAALGVAFFSGVRASAPDMRLSADLLYDKSEFMDIRVLGTMGITREDISAIRALKGVEYVQGGYSTDVLCDAEDVQLVVRLMSATEEVNKVTVTEGRMPEKKSECLADERFLSLSGYKIGDTIRVKAGTDDDIKDSLSVTEFKIVGCGTTAYYLSLDRGTSNIGNGELSSYLIVPEDSFSMEVYTEAFIRVKGAADAISFSEEYEETVKAVEDYLEDISGDQCQFRYETIYGEGTKELEKARNEIAESKQKLNDAKKELDNGEKELADGEKKLTEAAEEIKDSEDKISQGEKELADGETRIQDGKSQILDGWNTYYENEEILKNKKQELQTGKEQILQGENQIQSGLDEVQSKKAALQDAEGKLKEGKEQLVLGKNQVSEGIKTLQDAIAEVEGKISEIETSLPQAEQGIQELENGIETVSVGIQELQAGMEALNANRAALQEQLDVTEIPEEKEQIQASIEQLDSQITQMQEQLNTAQVSMEELNGQLDSLTAQKAEMEQALLLLTGQKEELPGKLSALQEKEGELNLQEAELNKQEQQLMQGKQQLATAEEALNTKSLELAAAKQQLATGEDQITEGEDQLYSARNQLTEKEAELEAARVSLENARTELDEGRKKLADGKKEFEKGQLELAENKAKLEDGKKEYEEKKAEADKEIEKAEKQIADGQKELDELEIPEWYILNRDYIQTYVEYEQDSDRVKAIGDVFPAIFFLVAALICLTTMTRMVEEERTQIGTLKALGYGKFSIAAKYLCYALFASLAGSIVGLIVGQKILPPVIIHAYGILYTSVTEIAAPLHWGYSISSTLLAIACTTLAAGAACYKVMAATPAQLMRPAAPKSGKRVFLERVGFIWNHMSFTNKSTVRNLFRYKKRFFMTILGIGGCMGLLLVGFGLKDSIRSIGTIQYNDLMSYHAEIVLDEKASQSEKNELLEAMEADEDICSFTAVYKTSMDVENLKNNVIKSAYILVPEKEEELKDYADLRNRTTGEHYQLSDDGIIISEKLAKLLDVQEGDSVVLKEAESQGFEVKISHITENYFMHYIYISPGLYEQTFHETPDFYHYLTINTSTESSFEKNMQEKYMAFDQVSEVSFITKTAEKIANMLKSMDTIIYVLVISAGLLAFVVLYNLNNINISERIRELATLKVLGFYDKEVSRYVLRENICLTVIGSILGIFIGKILHRFIILTAETDIMMFGRDIWFESYIYSIILTFFFSAVVNFFMHFRLKKVDMVESMKSVE